MAEWKIPGLALAIVKDDEILLTKGYGLREGGKPERVDEHTLFAIASNTKAFTAAAIGVLVQEGKLSWDEPVTRYLPWFRLQDDHATQLITVRDLLCHRSGLGTWSGDMLQLSDYPAEEIIRRARHIPPSYPFRAGYGYCNLMFIAAGLVLEAVSGLSWDNFVQRRLFDPLGMTGSVTNSLFFGPRTIIAVPHVEIEGEVRPITNREEANFGAAGSICASAADIARWLRFQLGDGSLDGKRILETPILEETHTPQTLIPILPPDRKLFPTRHFTAYGLGWFMNDQDGRLVIRHTGGLDGMLSSTVLIPEEKLGVAVFTNKLPNVAYTALPYYILDQLMGESVRDWFHAYREFEQDNRRTLADAKQRLADARQSGTQPGLPLQAFAGEYDSAVLGAASVREQDGSLLLQLKAHESLTGKLTHWHYDTFLCTWDDPVLGESLVPFLTDGGGRVTEFHVTIRPDWIDPLEHIFKKL
jgi:CubicO group peptidase (beta-lactamase class C family)